MKKTVLILLVAYICTPSIGAARKLTLEECLAIAFENNPQLITEQKVVEKTKIMIGASFDAPNTEIELSQDATEGGGMDNGLKFSQEFDFPTLYIAKRKALKADYLVSKSSYDMQRNKLCGEVMAVYYNLIYLKNKIGVLEHLAKSYSQFAEIANKRFNAGEISKLECINADRLFSKAKNNLREAVNEKENKSLYLTSLLGITESVEPVEDEIPLLEPQSEFESITPELTYDGILLNSELIRSQKYVGVAKQDFIPGLFVGATSQLLIKGFNPYNIERTRFDKGNFMGFQVGISVPLFFGAKRSRLLAAKKDVDITKSRIEDSNNRIRREYSESLNTYRTSLENLKYYELQGLEQAKEISRLALISYELGEIDYLELMQNLESASSLEVEYLESVDRVNQSIIKLQTIKGIL